MDIDVLARLMIVEIPMFQKQGCNNDSNYIIIIVRT